MWHPVSRMLADRGDETSVCTLPPHVRTGQDVLDAYLAHLPTDRDLVLVPHSGAGAYVPALSVQRPVVATVFVDAVLPPATGRVPLAPAALLDLLRRKVDADGLLPPWTSWWDEADVAPLFPDADSRAGVEREQRRLPLAYFTEALAVPPGWDERPGAYVAFGDTYADERADAARRAWPVRRLAGGHLHPLHDPELVADTLRGLLDLVVPGVAQPRSGRARSQG